MIFKLIMHSIADTDTDENNFEINFSVVSQACHLIVCWLSCDTPSLLALCHSSTLLVRMQGRSPYRHGLFRPVEPDVSSSGVKLIFRSRYRYSCSLQFKRGAT